MKFLIKILGEGHQFPALHVEHGRTYTFPWNETLRAYTYEPKSQAEIDAVFESQNLQRVYTFVPHLVPAAPAPITITAALIASLEAQVKTDDETIAMLRADLSAQQAKAAPKPAAKGAKPKPATASETSNDDELPV